MANDQRSNKPWRSNTSELDEGSFNGVPICLALAKETTGAGKKRDKEKTRVSQRGKQDIARGVQQHVIH
jgi:hypothetical protein